MVADATGNEVGYDRTAGCNLFFLKCARGKVHALARSGDYASLTHSVKKTIGLHYPRLLSHQTKELPVAGCVMVCKRGRGGDEDELVGFLSVAGANTTPADDVHICRAVLVKQGLTEGDDEAGQGVGRFYFPVDGSRKADFTAQAADL